MIFLLYSEILYHDLLIKSQLCYLTHCHQTTTLDRARISLVVGELCCIVIEQIGDVVHILVYFILALISNHS